MKLKGMFQQVIRPCKKYNSGTATTRLWNHTFSYKIVPTHSDRNVKRTITSIRAEFKNCWYLTHPFTVPQKHGSLTLDPCK